MALIDSEWNDEWWKDEDFKRDFAANEKAWREQYECNFGGNMGAGLKSCRTCGGEFNAKFDWSDQCTACFMASPQGKQWKARKDAEANGFGGQWRDEDFGDAQRRAEEANQRQRAHQQRFNEQFNDFFGQNQRHGQNGQQRDPWGKFAAEDKLDAALLRKLIMLCHPDKHGGSALSNEVTKVLLGMKERMK